MPCSAGSTAILLAFLSVASAGSAWAQQAGAPCSGTLCDLWYSNHPAPAASAQQPVATTAGVPAGATPLTVPSGNMLGHLFGGGGSSSSPATAASNAPPEPPTPAQQAVAQPAVESASNSYMEMNGGGVLNGLRGAPTQRCTGTFCDVFYGGSPPEPAAPAAAAPHAATQTAAAGVAYDDAPRVPHKKRITEQDTRPPCASSTRDAWSCFR